MLLIIMFNQKNKNMEYTEHKKFDKISDAQKAAIMEFVEFLESQDYFIGSYEENGSDSLSNPPVVKTHDGEKVFHQMLGIDEEKLEEERKEMLNNLKQ